MRHTPRPLADAVVQQLDALMTRRRQLLGMLTAERIRLEHAVGPTRRSLVDHIRCLERRVAAVDGDLDTTIARRPAQFSPACAAMPYQRDTGSTGRR